MRRGDSMENKISKQSTKNGRKKANEARLKNIANKGGKALTRFQRWKKRQKRQKNNPLWWSMLDEEK